MDEFRENGRLRGALDASLSGLNGDPYLARRLIACAEKQPKAVRKRSIGLVFAFVALLAAVSVAAAAALNLFEQFGQSSLPQRKNKFRQTKEALKGEDVS